MPKHEGVFVPHRHCTVASGACFDEGECLAGCSVRQKKDHEARIKELERRLVKLETAIIRHGIKIE